MGLFETDFGWWFTVIELPVLASLFLRIEKLAEDLTKAKLDAAQFYASQMHVHELEERLTSHLLRIERKLDTTSLQTAALQARQSHKEKDKC